MATILLVRHGETPWNRAKRIQGWAPTPLTEAGVRQAKATGERIAAEYAVDRIEASDLRRVIETVRWIRRAGRFDVPVQFEAAWRERDFGKFQGLSYRAFFEGYPEYSLRQVGVSAATESTPGGESLLEMYDRVVRAWDILRTSIEDDETVLLVSHGGPIRAIVGAVKGVDIVESMLESDQDNCSINEIEIVDGIARVVHENGTATVTRR